VGAQGPGGEGGYSAFVSLLGVGVCNRALQAYLEGLHCQASALLPYLLQQSYALAMTRVLQHVC